MTNLAIASIPDRYELVYINPDNVGLASAYYDQLVRDGLLKQSFPNSSVSSKVDFISMSTDGINQLFICTRNYQPAAHVNLNGFNGRVAHAHFSVLRAFHGDIAIEMGIDMVRQLFLLQRQDGSPLIHHLIGITAVINPLAFRFSKKIGYKYLATLRDAYAIDNNNFVDAHLTMLSRSDHNG